MKKTIAATFCGMMLGVLLVIGVFGILHVKYDNNDVFAQNLIETIGMADTEVVESTEDTESVEVEATEAVANAEADVPTTEEEGVATTTNSDVNYPYYIKVNRQSNCVTVYAKDDNGEYTVPVKAMVCSVGLNNTTPLGVGEISDKYDWRLLFGDVYGQYAVRFNGHIMFHSVPYTTTSKDALKEGEYNLLGQPASQGCIRLSVADAKWIYDNCRKGTQVEVYDSADPGPLGKPESIYVDPYSFFRGWDPTDPDPANPWNLYGTI